jgi:adenylate cyclase, class 2
MHEVEVKYRLTGSDEHERLRRRLTELGAVAAGSGDEQNQLYDRPDRSLGAHGQVLRLRVVDGGPGAKMTFKGPASFDGMVKSRREIEFSVSDAAGAAALLEALGYVPAVRYDKHRETWRLDDVEVTLDTLVIGHFCEVEGPAERITAVAAALGLREDQAESSGYPSLVARWQRDREPAVPDAPSS